MFRVAMVHVSPNRPKMKYRCYSPTSMTNAYLDVVENKISVHKASKVYSVPEQTLRDRVLGKINAESVKSGPGPLLSQLEEVKLVEHIKTMASVGYGYTRAEVINTASEYAVYLGKRNREEPLKFRWFYSFMRRWPELKVQRPKSLSELRAKAMSRESINMYFEELGFFLTKYDLHGKPQNIYNVDEKGIQQNFTPPCVVGAANCSNSLIMSERSSTTTILGCGNALGHQIPPYFVFAGAMMRSELLQGSSVGSDGTVSKTGWSNGDVFHTYLTEHSVKFAKGDCDAPILLLYDGHRSHISPAIIDCANENNIILYVLPPHTSHILQPMDVGCFGPFSKIYSDVCNKFQRNTGASVGRYNVCELACKAYTNALSPRNLQSSFRKSGIYPYNPNAINTDLLVNNQLRKDIQIEIQNESTTANDPNTLDESTTPSEPTTPTEPITEKRLNLTVPVQTVAEESIPEHVQKTCVALDEENTERIDLFFKKKRPVFNPPFRKPRCTISKICSGKAITEKRTATAILSHISASKPKKMKFQQPKKSVTTKNVSKVKRVTQSSPVPGPSRCQKAPTFISMMNSSDSEQDDSTEETDKCCVCNKFSPEEKQSLYLELTSWGKCDLEGCTHWVHLKYCCPVRTLRRHDIFYCPCHGMPWRVTEE